MIYVFKTSVEKKWQVEALKAHIDQLLPNAKWNFDLEDCDKILRVESDEDATGRIIELLSRNRFSCQELD